MARSSSTADMVPGGPVAARTTTAIVATAVVTAVLLLAGIVGAFTVDSGSDGTSVSTGANGSSAAIVPAAAIATQKAGPLRFALTFTSDITNGTGSTKANASVAGALDTVKRIGSFRAKVDGTGGDADKVGELDAVLVDGSAYLSGSAVAKRLPAGKEFLKVPLASLGSGMPDSTSTPGELLAMLQGAVGTPKRVGTEKVRGVETEHFTIDIDLGKAATVAQSEAAKARAGTAAPAAPAISIPSILVPAGVWIDKDGQVRRARLTIDPAAIIAGLSKQAGSALSGTPELSKTSGTAVLTLELFDFGEAVEVEAPPADKVVDAPVSGASAGLLQGLMGSGTR